MSRTGSLDHLVKRQFGRRTRNAYAAPMRGEVMVPASPAAADTAKPSLLDDLKLFATTFAGGFVFMAVYLA